MPVVAPVRHERHPTRLTLGTSEVFLNGIAVGLVRGAEVNIEWEDAVFEAFQPQVEVARIRQRERATIRFNRAQFDENLVADALPDSVITTGASIRRSREVVTFTTDTQDLAVKTELASGTFTVESASVVVFQPPATPGGAHTYFVNGTDFSVTADGVITRIATGAIPSGARVLVIYDYTDNLAQAVTFGARSCALPTFKNILLLTRRSQDCVPVMVEAYRCISTSPFTLSLTEGEFVQPQLTFSVLADVDRNEGDRLVRVVFGRAVTGALG